MEPGGKEDNEEEKLRSVALENARTILEKRQRAERQLVSTKNALEQRTQQLARSVAMMQATLESTFDAIVVTDDNRRVTGFNEKYTEMWRIPRELMESADHSRMLAVCAQQFADPESYLARVEEIYTNSPPESLDVLWLADGRVYERFSKIQYVEGSNAGRVWSIRDITAHKRTEAQLREQRAWFEVTLSSIGDAVITTDVRGHVTFLNPIGEAMTGWSLQEARGVHLERIFRIVNEHTRQPVANPVSQVLREDAIVGLANHTVLIAKDGTEVAIEDSAAPIRDANGAVSGAVMVFHDVTDRRRAEIALREADRRKDEFIAILAHELRNPLAPIRQAALISKAPGATEAQKRWSHDVIDRQVQYMSLLLDDLLDISRVTRGTLALRMQITELASAVNVAIETARPVIDAKRHVLSIDLPHQPVRFTADPLRVAQVLSNLLTNAAKYTDPEGQIRLSASCQADQLVIRVADSGVGIRPENLPDIFKMFSQVHPTTDRSEGGLGIGLALARGLVELHGGSIEASSAGLGYGSEFTVRMPLRAHPDPRAATADTAVTPARITRRRILVADDNRDSAETLAMLLRVDGHEVMIAHDGSAALAAFGGFAPDVVLLDIGMPGPNGYEVAQKIRQSRSGVDIKLIAITGWGQEADKERAFAAGFDHHLTKPVDTGQLSKLLAW
jgi:PAS domain S-box-containing protein